MAGFAGKLLIVILLGPQLKTGNSLLNGCNLFLLGGVKLLLAQAAQFPLTGIGGVIAVVEGDTAVFQLGNVRCHLVQQIAVVGNDEDTARVLLEQFLELPFGGHI